MIALTDAERRVLNELIGQEYGTFKEVAERYLNEDEIQELEDKLSKQ